VAFCRVNFTFILPSNDPQRRGGGDLLSPTRLEEGPTVGSGVDVLLCNFAPPCVSTKPNEIRTLPPYRQGSREKCGCFWTCIRDQTGNLSLPLPFLCKRREQGEVLRPSPIQNKSQEFASPCLFCVNDGKKGKSSVPYIE